MLFPIIALIFLTAFSLAIAVWLAASGAQASPKGELKRRLRQMARQSAREMPAELKSEITRGMTPADRFLSRLPLVADLDRKLDRAGVRLSMAAFVAVSLGLALAGGVLTGLATGSFYLALPAAALTVALCFGYLRAKTRRRVDRFTELFPEALTMISRSLRAGHSFNTAVQLVGSEVANPVGELFKTAYHQQVLGLRIIDGLNGLNGRIDSLDLRFFTTVISINSEIGGNLSEVLEKLAETIRERLRIRKQVRVYTAQGRMSGYVLGALPIFAFVLFNILNPSYESALLKETMGVYILLGAACLQLIGLLVIRNIIKIRI